MVVNNPPAFSSSTAARSVAENTAAGQNVGAALTATDLDGHTLIYTLEGTDAASFGILSASGQIQTKAGVTYNHEAKSTYTVIVKADDSNGGTDTVTVTITVTDVNEPPGVPAAPSVTATVGIDHQPGRELDRADEHRPRPSPPTTCNTARAPAGASPPARRT